MRLTSLLSWRFVLVLLALALSNQVSADDGESRPSEPNSQSADDGGAKGEHKLATFGGGCFWCVEAVFQRVKGVEKVVSGYAGGHVPKPTYQMVCTGRTGHAEVCQITYDPQVVSYDSLLEIFWRTHDPTTLNRQGPDVGTQYRSVIFYHDRQQQETAQSYKEKLNKENVFGKPVVTEISEAPEFYPAEDYHQNYFNQNKRARYCQFVVAPKVEKFKKIFADKAKQ